MVYTKTPGFKQLPQTGVIYVLQRAAEKGRTIDDPQWSNLGQGAPEVGSIEGAVDRVTSINVSLKSHEYGLL